MLFTIDDNAALIYRLKNILNVDIFIFYGTIQLEVFMVLFHDYSENGEILTSHQEFLTRHNIMQYEKEHGTERLFGYKEAIDDLILFIIEKSPTSYALREHIFDICRTFQDHEQTLLATANPLKNYISKGQE